MGYVFNIEILCERVILFMSTMVAAAADDAAIGRLAGWRGCFVVLADNFGVINIVPINGIVVMC